MNVNKRSSSKKQIIAALLANIPAVTYGIQIGWLSPMTEILQSGDSPARSEFSDDVITMLAAALPLVAMVSVPLFSFLSDYLGRKKTIISLSIFTMISWILKILTINPIGLIIARSLAGIASSGCFLVVPVYVKEISEDHLRGALGSLLMLSCNFGVIFVYIFGMSIPYVANQILYLSISVGHVLVFYFMPESPAFLVKKKNIDKAKESISWLHGLALDDMKVMKEIDKLNEEDKLHREMPQVNILDILKQKTIIRPLLVCFVLIAVQTLSGCFAIVNYASVVFRRSGSDWGPNYLALFVGGLQLSGSIVAVFGVERCGRKILLSASCFIISLCMVSVATYFLYSDTLPQWLPVAAVCVCIFSYGAGLAPVPFVYMAEVFSFQLRAKLVGAVMVLSWFDSTITVLLFSTVASKFGEHSVFYGFAAITMFGALFTLVFVPETKGKSLEEIQRRFGGEIK